MKVTKAQAQANRAHIVETASTLFRERGYDGVGVAELMAAAGFTHGGFYKHFRSKAELMAEAAACGFAQTAARSEGTVIAGFITSYVSRQHRDTRSDGCPLAALGGDAARQPEAIKALFAEGIERLLAGIERDGATSGGSESQARAKAMDVLTRAVGALVLSRSCPDDSPLADEILDVCRAEILGSLASTAATR